MEQIKKSSRMEWLDALRGFTMIMVVANHVSGIGFDEPYKVSSALPLLVLFRMPLFFFICGFLAFKSNVDWNLKILGRSLLKKLRIQTIPTVVFFLIAAVFLGKHFEQTVLLWLGQPTKGGYWFTLVLLYMFIIYYLFCYLEAKINIKRKWIPITILFVVSLCLYETCYLPHYFSWGMGRKVPNEFMNTTCFARLFMYFPFFVYGNIVRRYWDKMQEVFDSKWFFPIVVILVFFAACDSLEWHYLRKALAIVPLTVARFGLLTMVFLYFRYYQQHLTKHTLIGSGLQYIGRRTLDIYLIHFLFLPNLPSVGQFFKTFQNNFVLDVTLSVLMALLIIAFSVVASNILRISPIFRKYLFGRN